MGEEKQSESSLCSKMCERWRFQHELVAEKAAVTCNPSLSDALPHPLLTSRRIGRKHMHKPSSPRLWRPNGFDPRLP